MNEFIKFLLADNLKNLEEFKLNGEVVIDKSLVINAITTPLKETAKTTAKTKKIAKEKLLDSEGLKTILSNFEIKEFNLSTSSEKVTLKFDMSKGKDDVA